MPRPATGMAIRANIAPPVCPENLKLFIDLTFFEFLLMLDLWNPPSSGTPLRGGC
jgi:hypothetical protein